MTAHRTHVTQTTTFLSLCIATAALATPLSANTFMLSEAEQIRTQLAIYNQNTALVSHDFAIPKLNQGDQVIVTHVPKSIDSTSLSVTNGGRLLEQSVFNTPAFSTHRLLQDAINQTITLSLNEGSNSSKTITGKLLAFDANSLILRTTSGQQVITRSFISELHFEPKSNLNPVSTLSGGTHLSFLSAGTKKANELKVRYQATGINWNMDYRLDLSSSGKFAKLTGLTHITNHTESQFKDAKVQLIAGQVNQVPAQMAVRAYAAAPKMMAMADSAMVESVTPEAVGALYRYALTTPLTLQPQQSKQVPLISADQVSVKRDYQFSFYVNTHAEPNPHESHPNTRLQFNNSANNQLNTPLPAGNVRVFAHSPQHEPVLIGGQRINHTAKGEQIKLNLGQAFDIKIKRYQHSYQKYSNYARVGQTLEITNASDQAAILVLDANLHRSFKLENATIKPSPSLGNRLTWQLTVPANGSQTLKFTAKINLK